MRFDNIVKGPVTTIIGTLIMVVATVLMALQKMPIQWEGAMFFGLGFALLFMRDSLVQFIKTWVNKKLS